MFRYFIIASTLLLGGGNASAQTSQGTPLSSFCSGKYSDAAMAIDKANRLHGTLYSGSSHFRHYSTSLVDTINLYRATQGFDPLNYKGGRQSYSYNFDLSRFKPTASSLTKALRLMTWPDPDISAEDIPNNIILLDVLTSRGPSDDWWLRVDDFKTTSIDKHAVGRLTREEAVEHLETHVTPTQRIVADMIPRHDELDWLQSALILSTYTHPWTTADGTSPSPSLAALFEHIENKALGGDFNRAWLALLSNHKFYDRNVPDDLASIQSRIATEIETCSASPEHYAALVAGHYPLPDSALSPDHLDLTLEIEARNVVFKTDRTPVFDADTYFEISALKDRASDKRKIALPLILSAPNLTELEKVASLNDFVTRPLVLLSGRDLENISPGAAFTRHVALKRPIDAKRVLEKAINRRPELRADIADILDDDLPLDVQMMMVTLRLRCLSHLMSDFCTLEELDAMSHMHRDIPKRFTTHPFIQTELNAWIYPEETDYAYGGYYNNKNGLGEAVYYPLHNRRRTLQRGPRPQTARPSDHPVLTEFSSEAIAEYKSGLRQASGLMALADWAEFEAISGERRLTRALSLDIIAWVRTAPSDPAMAEALHRVVRLNKHEVGGELDGKPVGKLAFELLHQKFPDSDWTRRTPYWWPPRYSR